MKALFGFDAIVGNYASPYAAGSAYVMLHHAFGEVNGKKGVWGHAIGGMGAITQAMARAARGHGVEIETEAGVREVIVEGDRAAGVILDNGETIRAKYVVSGVNPKLLYTRLVPAGRAGAGIPRAHRALAQRLRHLPDECRAQRPALVHRAARRRRSSHRRHHPGAQPRLHGPRLAGRARAWLEPRAGGRGADPLDARRLRLRPTGQHVASLFCQHVAPELPDGKSWDDHRDEVADLMIATVDKYAPGFAASVIGRQVLSPLDLERQFGLLGGDIFHGALTLNQLFSARPMLGHADYRGPLKGLYHCGSGAHPGGGVTGAPGHNAARVILGDHRALFG